MILLLTNERDLTCDYIVLELKRRKLPYYRLNSEHISKSKLAFDPSIGEDSWKIDIDDKTIKFSSIKAGYFRRPGLPVIDSRITSEAAKRYCEVEWGSALSFALRSLGQRWLNSPSAILEAENKPLQLSTAHALEFSVPETIISNDFSQISAFAATGGLIAKPIREALLIDNNTERVIFTSRINSHSMANEASITASPVIYQREVPKKVDIRVTVIGQEVYAAEILSQNCDETKTDWRRGSNPDLPHAAHELPDNISNKCIAMVQKMGLRFGAIDLVLDLEGNYWFLEINPNGQWAWIENRTGLPITKAIVDELERISLCSLV